MASRQSKLLKKIFKVQISFFLITTLTFLFILNLIFHVSGTALALSVIVAGVLALFLTSFFLGKSVRKRVEDIQQIMDRGQFLDEKTTKGGEESDELDILETRMKRMTDAILEQANDARDERGRMAAILENMNEGVIAVDEDCRVLFVNPAAESILEIPQGTAGIRSLLEITSNPKIDTLVRQAMIRRLGSMSEIAWGYRKEKILKIQVIPLSQEKTRVRGILVMTDMTEIRRLEGLRREFVANVSHELKTPLTSIQGFVETLLSGAYQNTEQSRSFLEMMEQDTSRLTRLIDDLLELSRLDTRQVDLNLQRVDIHDEIKTALNLCQNMIQAKEIRVVDELSENEDWSLRAERDRVRQVLLNLLTNAVKFNKRQGEIRLSGQRKGNQISISIRDTGCGIPEEVLPRIFERFFRVDKARSRELGGTGLGLSIVKHIVEAHGGRVSCRSKLNEGSEFTFSLPIECAVKHGLDGLDIQEAGLR